MQIRICSFISEVTSSTLERVGLPSAALMPPPVSRIGSRLQLDFSLGRRGNGVVICTRSH